MVSVDTSLTEAANEVFNVGIQSQANIGQQVTVRGLVDKFGSKPYGWDQTSTLVVIASLFGQSRITIEHNGNLLKRTEVASILKNTQQLANLKVSLQKVFDEKKVAAFRKFITDFFDEVISEKGALELASVGAGKLKDQLARLNEMRAAYDYPFIVKLDPAIEMLDSVVGKTSEWYLTEFDKIDALLDVKETILDPIRAFFMDNRKEIYDQTRKFLRDAEGNLGYLPSGTADPIKGLLDDPDVFRGNKIVELQAAAKALQSTLDQLVDAERQEVIANIKEKSKSLSASEEFQAAPERAQHDALVEVDAAIALVEHESDIAKIRLAPSTFADKTLLRLLSGLVAATGTSDAVATEPKPAALVKIGSLAVPGAKLVLTTEDDIDEYLASLRTVLVKTIQEGKGLNP